MRGQVPGVGEVVEVRAYDKMRRVCGAAHTVYRAAREILVASF